jgi:hypothetical protein
MVKKSNSRSLFFMVLLSLLLWVPASPVYAERAIPASALSDLQSNSITMLNYLSALTMEINVSKQSRLFLEEAYSSLINNIHPNAVDEKTEMHLFSILDNLEKYRMVTVKRERSQYIFELSQAQAIKSAIPNPLGLLSVIQAGNPLRMIASVAYMAVDSAVSYSSSKAQAELEHLKGEWELDDEESAVLHETRKDHFIYMLNSVRDYGLPGDLVLNEKAVEDFVTWKNSSNLVRRIHFFENNEKTYQSFGPYWLARAEAYFNVNEYGKCLEAVDRYEKIQSRIFRKDHDFARILPLAILAAREVYDAETYRTEVERFGRILVDNIDNEDWKSSYFLAQTYVDLAGMSHGSDEKTTYLTLAYELTLNSVNHLVVKQRALNNTYLSPVEKLSTAGTSGKDKKKVKAYNAFLEENRRTELAPISEALVINLDLLYALADELNITGKEWAKIAGILRDDGAGVFLVTPLNDYYRLSNAGSGSIEVRFASDGLTIPSMYLCDESVIEVVLTTEGVRSTIEDWNISSVERTNGGSAETFTAVYRSKNLKEYRFDESTGVVVKIFSDKEGIAPMTFAFAVDGYKKGKLWLKDTVTFKRVL